MERLAANATGVGRVREEGGSEGGKKEGRRAYRGNSGDFAETKARGGRATGPLYMYTGGSGEGRGGEGRGGRDAERGEGVSMWRGREADDYFWGHDSLAQTHPQQRVVAGASNASPESGYVRDGFSIIKACR